MKKTLYLGFIVLILGTIFCKEETVKKTTEGNVEIIHNKLRPYKSEGGTTNFTLEKEFAIDTEKKETAEKGLTDITHFTVDSRGNVYLLNPKNEGNLIFKFGVNGNLLTSFGRKGQGPGELERPSSIHVNGKNEIVITDPNVGNLLKFDTEGNLLDEISISDLEVVIPLKNEKYLTKDRMVDPAAKYFKHSLSLCNLEFKNCKELDVQKIPNPIAVEKFKGIYYILSWGLSEDKIFTGFQERGYEIYVYDLEGTLIKKIKKEYEPVQVYEEYKKRYMKQFEGPIFEPVREKTFFPDSMPAYHSFFTDDKGRIFVMTYERGDSYNEYMFDIFNPEGVYTGKKGLQVYWDSEGVYAQMKRDRLYALQENENGYKKLVVSKVNWVN